MGTNGDYEMARLSMFLLAALAICVNVTAYGSSTDGGSTDDAASIMINRHQAFWCLKQLKKNENLRSMGLARKTEEISGLVNVAATDVGVLILDGTVIPHTTLSSGGPHFTEAECRAFRIQAAPMMIKPQQTVSTSGTHGCIDCVIGTCHQCLCREALKRCSSGVANVLDIFNKAKNQYLVCEGSRITCHPCPKGLVWNCQKQVCDVISDCPPIPADCNCDCGISDKIKKSSIVSTFTTTTVMTTANSETSTIVAYHSIHAPLPAPRS